MSGSYPIMGWETEPMLWLDHDFDHDVTDATATSTTVRSLYRSEDQSWQVAAIQNAASSITKVGSEFGHNGVYAATTGATAQDGYAVANTLDSGSFTTGRVNASNVYRWDWWIKTDGAALTNSILLAGLSDNIPNNATATNAVMLGIRTATDATNFQYWVRSASGNFNASTSIAFAVNTWYKFSGVRLDTVWRFLINDKLIASESGAFTGAPVIPFASCFTVAAASRSFSWDRCRVWTDGLNMIG